MHRVNLSLHELFQALADPFRIRLVALLLKSKDEICLCEFSESLDEPEYKLSRHVKVLKSSGFLNSIRDGKWIYHSLVRDQKYLKYIYQAIEAFPDDDNQLKKDFQRFQKRTVYREKGRCQQPSRIANESSGKRARA